MGGFVIANLGLRLHINDTAPKWWKHLMNFFQGLRLHINDTAPKFYQHPQRKNTGLRLHINDTAPKCEA
ncbi:MAG: hypothetical protein ACRC8C_00985 [Mycoplasmoidaceae bacterium]